MTGLELIKLIHYGKCNDVFVSKDSKGNKFALKRFYKPELENRKEYVNKDGKLVKKSWFDDFKRSLDIQLLVNDESCVKCYAIHGIDPNDCNNVGNEIELIYELCEYGCLMELEDFSDPIPDFPKEVIKCICKDILQALYYLSTINVAHRDIKPNNIFLNKNGRCKLGDFSESDFMDENGKVRGCKGSYYFLSPEVFQLDNGNYIDEKDGNSIDMWALGITLWILYFRKFPYDNNKSIYDIIQEIQEFNFENNVKKMLKENKEIEIDEDFMDLLSKILEKEPENRIKPKEALEHKWLSDVNYEVAKSYCLKHKSSVI